MSPGHRRRDHAHGRRCRPRVGVHHRHRECPHRTAAVRPRRRTLRRRLPPGPGRVRARPRPPRRAAMAGIQRPVATIHRRSARRPTPPTHFLCACAARDRVAQPVPAGVGEMGSADIEVAQAFADVVTIAILRRRAALEAQCLSHQLDTRPEQSGHGRTGQRNGRRDSTSTWNDPSPVAPRSDPRTAIGCSSTSRARESRSPSPVASSRPLAERWTRRSTKGRREGPTIGASIDRPTSPRWSTGSARLGAAGFTRHAAVVHVAHGFGPRRGIDRDGFVCDDCQAAENDLIPGVERCAGPGLGRSSTG